MYLQSRLRRTAALSAFLAFGLPVVALSQVATSQTTSEEEPEVDAVIATEADTAGTSVELAPIVVEDEARPGMAPVQTEVIERETMEKLQVESLADIGRRMDAGVSVNSDNDSVAIRGLDQNRVLTTVDGIRIPWLDDGARGVQGGVSAFDFNSISSIDLMKGPDSSFFGSGALGGVLALRTLDPEDLLQGDKTFGGLTKLGLDTADRSWNVNQALATRINQTYILLQGGYKQGHAMDNKGEIGGTGTTRTKPDPQDNHLTSFLGKINQHVDGGHRFGLTGEFFERDIDENTLTSIGSTYGTYQTKEQSKRSRISASYDFLPSNGGEYLDEAHLQVYWQDTKLNNFTSGDRLTAPVGLYIRDSDLKEETFGIQGTASRTFDTGFGEHRISFGGSFEYMQTSQYAGGQDNCTPMDFSCMFLHVNQSDMPDTNGTSLGLAIEDRISFAGGAFRITPGLRFDWYSQDPQRTASFEGNAAYTGMPPSSSDWAFSPKILVEYDVTEKATLFAQWAQAFRAPTATELYLNYGGTGTYLAIGNPNLKPETSNGFEIGADLGDETLGGRITGFYNLYKNFLDTESISDAEIGMPGMFPFGVTRNINRADVHIYGIEASGQWQIGNGWHTWGSLAWTVGKDQDTGQHLNSVAPLTAIVGLGYATEEWGSDLSVTAVAARNDVEDPASSLNKTPGYGLVDLTAWWAPTELDGLQMQVGIFNLLDQTYVPALDVPDSSQLSQRYYSGPGRSFRATLTYQF